MMGEYDKCRFCKSYDDYEGCTSWFCENKCDYTPNRQRIIEKSQETGLSIADIVALIEMG